MKIHTIIFTLLIAHQILSLTLYSVAPDFKVSYTTNHNELAHIYYDQKLNQNGINQIWAYANMQKSLTDQHRGVGFLEGYATYRQIYAAYINFQKYYIHGSIGTKKLQDYIEQQSLYLQHMIETFQRDIFWQHVSAYLEQQRYSYRGYLQRIHEEGRLDMYIGFSQFNYLAYLGDLQDLYPAFYQNKTKAQQCTVYIRHSQSGLDISHSNIKNYIYLLRILKTYNFPSRDIRVGSQSLSFTSRPASLDSNDDFYILSSGLKVTQTSLNNFNPDNYKFLDSASVPGWLRATVSSNLARNAEQWAFYFGKYNSGTHNNQWIIIDEAALQSQKKAILFLEEAFDIIKISDMTTTLIQKGYIGSYNVPFNKAIYDKLNYQQYPYDYNNDPRGTILKNYHAKIKNVEDMKYWLRQNQQKDPKKSNAPRFDLDQQNPLPYGQIDVKIINKQTQNNNFYWFVSGPTTSDGRFPPFNWKAFNSYSHEYLPIQYNFQWVNVAIDFKPNSQKQLNSQQIQ